MFFWEERETPALETFPVALDDQDEAGAVMSFLVSWLISYQ